ncbi:MAG: Icc protein [Cellvibrionaceae bacterium]|jgi:Icc protein
MIKLIHITDSHLGVNPGDPLLEMNPDESLMDVVALIGREQSQIDLVLVTGDIANDASPSAYQRFHSTVSDNLIASMAWLPGNHDDDQVMGGITSPSKHQLIHYDRWLIIMLDSHVPGEIHGNFSQSELDYLSTVLNNNSEKYVLIAFHHQPVPVGSHWMDRYIIRNTTVFWELINAHEKVRCVIWGHIHQEYDKQENNVRLLSTPSTCIQFSLNQVSFKISAEMPGYRWLELHDDGKIKTAVSRVPEKNYGIDFSSTGY